MSEILKYIDEYLLHGDERCFTKAMNLFDDLDVSGYSPLELYELQDIFGFLTVSADREMIEECVDRLAKFS